MDTTDNNIIKIIDSDDLNAFKSFLSLGEDTIKGNYPSILNALVFKKRANMLKELFNEYPNLLNIKTSKGYNIAHVFAIKNIEWGVSILKTLDDNIFLEKNKQGLTPLYLACTTATGELWDFFLNHNTSLEQINNEINSSVNVTPLYLAVYAGDEKKVDDLIKSGANVNKLLNGVSALDVALEKGNWDIIGSLVSNMDTITPKFVLHAVKSYPKSEKAMQAFIDNPLLQDKIFPLMKDDKLSVWSYFFYYASWDFVEKNQSFLHERFIPDLNKNEELKSVIYSCFLGKRDSFKKIEWLIKNTKIKWVSTNTSSVKNASTFGKAMPSGFASFVDRLDKGDLEKLSKKISVLAPNLTQDDEKIMNISMIANNLDKMNNFKADKTLFFDRDLYKYFEKMSDDDLRDEDPLQYTIISSLKKIPNAYVKENILYLLEVCKTFKVYSDVLFKPFVKEIEESSSPVDYFNDFLRGTRKREFMAVILEDVLSDKEKNSYELLLALSDFKEYEVGIKNLILSDIEKEKHFKIRNFNFPLNINIGWDFDNNAMELTQIILFIAKNKYSPGSLSLLDKINPKSILDFDLGSKKKRNQKFYYQDFIKSLDIKVGLNKDFLNKFDEVFKESPNTLNAIYAGVIILGKNNVSDEAYEKAISFLNSLDKDVIKEIVNGVSFTLPEDKIQTDGMVDLLAIAHNKGVSLVENFWVNIQSSKLLSGFYVNVLSKTQDFSYFFDYVPMGDDIDSFSNIKSVKTEELINYFKESSISSWMKSASNFSNKDAIFIALELFSHQSEALKEDVVQKFIKKINDYINKDNCLDFNVSSAGNEIISLLSSNLKNDELIVRVLDESNLAFLSDHKVYIEKRAYSMKNIINKTLLAEDVIDVDSDMSSDFKI